MKQGFTLIELLIVVALIFIFSSVTFPVSYGLFHKSALKDEARNIESSLRKVQALAITGRGDSAAGVKLFQEDYTVFEGESYEDRRKSKDTVLAFPVVMEVDGAREIVFQKITGLPYFTGMIGRWDFNETEGEVVYDSANLYQNDGILSGTYSRSEGKDGSCLEFNGSTFVDLGDDNSLNVEDGLTISVWLNVSSANNGTVVKKGNPAQGTGYSLSLSGGYIVFSLGDRAFNQNISNLFDPALFNQWVYLASVWDGETMKQYANGQELSQTRSFSGSVGSSEEDLFFGQGLIGKLDDVRIFDYMISEQDVQLDYSMRSDETIIGLRSDQEKAYIAINSQGRIKTIDQ